MGHQTTWPALIKSQRRSLENQIGFAMTYLAQMLGTTLTGVVAGHTPAQLNRMNAALRQAETNKKSKY